MFTNIVWATDGSEHADRALDCATAIATREDARLHVVHIVEKLVGGRAAGQDVFLNEGQIDDKIKEQARHASAHRGIQTTVHMTPSGAGNIADRVAEIAADSDADLIVVGTPRPLGARRPGARQRHPPPPAPRRLSRAGVPPVKATPADASHHPGATAAAV